MDKQSKIFVAWHAGLVGSRIVEKLLSQGYTNLILKTRQELDLLNQVSVDSFFKQERPDVVILSAAKVGWVKVNSEFPFDMLYDNIQIQNNVIFAAHKHDVTDLLFIASSTVYPSDYEQPIQETSLLWWPLDPLHESYGFAKIEWIKLCEKIQKQFWKNFFTLVPTNIYGVWDHFEESRAHVIWALMTRFYNAKQNNIDEVVVWWSGNALREFLYVDDIADACVFFLQHRLSTSYVNIWTIEEISIKELAYMIKDIVWYDGNIVFDTTKPEWRLRRKLATNLASSLGWEATTSLQVGLQKTYEYFLNLGLE